jgi:hypothetical protein
VGQSWLALATARLFSNAGKLKKENEENRSSTIILNGVITLCIDSNTHLIYIYIYIYIYNASIPSNTTKIKDMVYSYMFRIIKSSSG